ncbi:hypothetical protein M407DRAFT_241874 [Tulasnella calospora MUT 4182]|uniref:Uncharacterized protein n=1 Tax=Tulasnella calospora MUT 4182 TaxID=1051891 RepID=A0A0C3LB97_9AGAM|nr:hypothetical protein M407DRAFT_241874 [Tulasnella calospora MUT 4182]
MHFGEAVGGMLLSWLLHDHSNDQKDEQNHHAINQESEQLQECSIKCLQQMNYVIDHIPQPGGERGDSLPVAVSQLSVVRFQRECAAHEKLGKKVVKVKIKQTLNRRNATSSDCQC